MKHLLKKMSTKCLTLAWQEWLPNNAGGSWLKSSIDTLFCPRVFVTFLVFVLYRIYNNLEKIMFSLQLNEGISDLC